MKKGGLLLWLWNATRVTLGFLFLLAASGKLRDPVKFMGGMDEYNLVHGWTLPLGAVAMPGIELLCALMLLLAWRTRAASMLVSGMLLLFIGAMGSALQRKLDLDCSCFDLMGADPALTAYGPLVRDLTLTALVLVFHFLGTEPSTVERPRLWRGLLSAALFAWIAFVLLDAASQSWRAPALHLLEIAFTLWVVFDLLAGGWATFRWGTVLRDWLVLGPIVWLIFHLLGDGAASLGWGTILRDVAMAVPALAMVVYGPEEA
jgi:hypothetical protein